MRRRDQAIEMPALAPEPALEPEPVRELPEPVLVPGHGRVAAVVVATIVAAAAVAGAYLPGQVAGSVGNWQHALGWPFRIVYVAWEEVKLA